MFGSFYNPFFDDEDYYYYRPMRIYHPFGLMDRYINNVERRMNSVFSNIFEEELNNMLENNYENQEEVHKKEEVKKEEPKKEEPKKEESENNFKKDLKETQKRIVQNRYVPHNYCKSYSTQSVYRNNEKFEEIREQTIQDDKTYITKIKRIDNRWVQVDEVIDKDGKKTSKETWHNVGEDEIDSFNDEWSLRRGIEGKSKEEVPSIKSEQKEDKKEEKKEE